MSNINILSDFDRIIDFDAEIPDGAFDFRMSEQELDSTEVTRSPVDQKVMGGSCRLRTATLKDTNTNSVVGRSRQSKRSSAKLLYSHRH